ncbi:MAG: HK97 gp10 family phage protein [Oscillospiraceae bacterium]|jgi:hypothetical protein|nr:HK97 gp10 family phage protein [Oscillospiraceae bacterium]
MKGTNIIFNTDEARIFFEEMKLAGNGGLLKKELQLFLEEIAIQFLTILQNAVQGDYGEEYRAMATRNLQHSFMREDSASVFELDAEALSATVGTNTEYASHVNDGHWLNPGGVEKRFVPGHWTGPPGDSAAQFIYEPGAETGMVLKQRWVEGRHFWEKSLEELEKLIPGFLEYKMQQWLDRYFV